MPIVRRNDCVPLPMVVLLFSLWVFVNAAMDFWLPDSEWNFLTS